MKPLINVVFVGSLVSVLALAACGGSGAATIEGTEGEAADAPPSPEAVAAEALTDRLSDSDITLVPTQRGVAELNYTQPQARREADFIVTNIRVRNQAENAIAGLQVDEFWFDADGNTVTGDSVRFREPLMPGEVRDIELRVPRDPAMDRSNYEFTHQNGEIEASLVEELPDPEIEEEDGAEGEAEEGDDEPS